ncbi:MAG: hypothetical protein IJS14_04635 [Lentisphaeria bacterium]|nr:hypothetical protein [Lentisphaeria bacterium]
MRFEMLFRRVLPAAAACLLSASVCAQPPAGQHGPKGPQGPRHRHEMNERPRRPMKGFWSRLTPEERARIDELARSGKKEELRKEIKALFFKYRPEEVKKLDELSAKYLQTTDEKERAAIRKEMEEQAKSLFRKRQEITRNNIAETERKLEFARKELDRLKKQYQDGEENADKIIADRVEQYCLPPEKRRKPNGRGFGRKMPPEQRRPADTAGPPPAK